MRPPLVIEQARKNGIGVQRLRISREQAEELKRIEAREGQAGGLKFLLSILRRPG